MRIVFAAAGIDTPDLDSRHLICSILAVDPVMLVTSSDRLVGSGAAGLNAAIDRRIQREPVSRILGWKEFYGRRFAISPATLDPRPDSETLIDAALAAARKCDSAALRILDVGTGSGCLLVTLLAELPDATGVGTDISPEALAVAERNGRDHGVASRIKWREQDCLQKMDLDFDVLVTNPPYVRSDDLTDLQPEAGRYDPKRALDGGADGLAFYRAIVLQLGAGTRIRCALLEVGYDQSVAVAGMLQEAGHDLKWPAAFAVRDLAGVPRCVVQMTR